MLPSAAAQTAIHFSMLPADWVPGTSSGLQDRTTDALIQQAVRDCSSAGDRRRTLLVIAHRIDTIMDCDQLLVLNKGRLVESGAPGELVRGGGVFARLVSAAQDAARRQGHAAQQ